MSEQTADTIFSDLGIVEFVIECSDLSITEHNFVPSARCIQDTKKRQLVTGSNLQRLRCYVCHLHHEQAMQPPYRARQCFARILKTVKHYKVDVAGDANATAYKCYKRKESKDQYNSSIAVMLREMQREVNIDRPLESRLHIGYSTNNHHTQLHSPDYPDCCFITIPSWRKPLGPKIVRKLCSNKFKQSNEKEKSENSSCPKIIEIVLRKQLGRVIQRTSTTNKSILTLSFSCVSS